MSYLLKKLTYSIVIYCLLICCFACNEGQENQKQTDASKLYKSSFSFRQLNTDEIESYRQQIKSLVDTILYNKGFNGSILIAKNGQILFEDYLGYANFETRDTLTAQTPFHLASISKTFTGMCVLKLWENGKLSLDDTLQKYFKTFPYQGITIRNLLCHRSGLPNYLHAMTEWNQEIKVTNQDVLKYLIEKKPVVAWPPDTHFNYCNTNYVLLALIIEQVSGLKFKDYLKKNLFEPLGMENSFLFTEADTSSYIPTWSVSKPYTIDAFDCTYGDKNIYSTVRDLLIWDKAMYEHRFIKKETTLMAYTPMSNEKETMHNYGLGWRLFYNGGDTLIYHNGKWHGSNTLFNRWVQDTATVIVLGNKTNHAIYDMKQVGSIFNGKRDTIGFGE